MMFERGFWLFSLCLPYLSSGFSCLPSARPFKSLAVLGMSKEPFPWESAVDTKSEETLLKIHLAIQPGVDAEVALSRVRQYTQAFPFAVVLPVQPLQYLPTHDGGVDVQFLRKKTEEKGSIDGGIRFFVSLTDQGDGVEIEAKRNSNGQTVSKTFTEKLVVQAFCDGINGKQDDRTGVAPADFVSIQSFFHKWM